MVSLFHIVIAHWSELDGSCNSESRVGFPMENRPEIEMGCYCLLHMISFFLSYSMTILWFSGDRGTSLSPFFSLGRVHVLGTGVDALSYTHR